MYTYSNVPTISVHVLLSFIVIKVKIKKINYIYFMIVYASRMYKTKYDCIL